jgi:hypothetical protein
MADSKLFVSPEAMALDKDIALSFPDMDLSFSDITLSFSDITLSFPEVDLLRLTRLILIGLLNANMNYPCYKMQPANFERLVYLTEELQALKNEMVDLSKKSKKHLKRYVSPIEKVTFEITFCMFEMELLFFAIDKKQNIGG